MDCQSETTTEAVTVRDTATSINMTHLPTPTVDWRALAAQLISVLEKAVLSRAVRAPYMPSIAIETTDASSAISSITMATSGASTASQHLCETDIEAAPTGSEQKFAERQTEGTKVVYGKARIAILFSGGVDSMVLAALVDRYEQ